MRIEAARRLLENARLQFHSVIFLAREDLEALLEEIDLKELMNPTRQEVESLIRSLAPGHGIDPDTAIRQCEAESSFNQAARSSCGALGLFQLMPKTAAWLKVNPIDWRQNVAGGLKYMGLLNHQYGSIDKALAAYNWGPGNLNKAIEDHGADWRNHLPDETSRYLDRILGA